MEEGCGYMKGFKQAGHSIFAHSRSDLQSELRGEFCLRQNSKPLNHHEPFVHKGAQK
jgi:hypothetical protein